MRREIAQFISVFTTVNLTPMCSDFGCYPTLRISDDLFKNANGHTGVRIALRKRAERVLC